MNVLLFHYQSIERDEPIEVDPAPITQGLENGHLPSAGITHDSFNVPWNYGFSVVIYLPTKHVILPLSNQKTPLCL